MTKTEERELILIRQGWELLLSKDCGRALLYDLMGYCGVFRAENLEDGLIQFQAGKRSVGLKLMADAEAIDREAFFTMWKEYAERKFLKEKEHEDVSTIDE